jgi:hypothetical protein
MIPYLSLLNRKLNIIFALMPRSTKKKALRNTKVKDPKFHGAISNPSSHFIRAQSSD